MDEIKYICEQYNITNYVINSDLSIDVDGDVVISNMFLTKIPIRFNRVNGDFNCSYNNLTDLKGFPRYIGGDIFLYDNKLTSLDGITDRIEKKLDIGKNSLTSLKGCPKWIGGHFICNDNLLSSLEFSPDYVGGSFYCSRNGLTDLVGSPKQVGGIFFCVNNPGLINLKGVSEKIGAEFYCIDTPLGSIFDKVDQHFLYTFNFYKIIKDNTVNLKRLKYVMDLYDQPIDLDEIEKYYRIV